jgi:OOP family OmpA-OmpF porin
MSQFKNKFAAIAVLTAGLAAMPASAAEYLSDSQGEVVKNAYDECWEVSYGLPTCGQKITFQGVLFDFNKTNIKPEFAAQLDDLAASLSGGFGSMVIEGHTDSIGSDSYNQGLSQRRADSVASYLAGKGLDRGSMMTVGMGESNPVKPNDTEENRYQNRRVEITIK